MANREKLWKFVQQNDLKTVEQLFQSAPELFATDSSFRKGESPLHIASRYGLMEMVEFLSGFINLNVTDNDGKTALHEAASAGHALVVAFFLKHGVNSDCLKAADWTPLMMACAKGHIGVMKILVSNGASITRVNKDGWNTFHIATRDGDIQIVSLLLDEAPSCWDTSSKNGRTPLHTAAIHGRFECLKLMLSTRCQYDINCKDSCGSTPLMDAIRKDHSSVVNLLLLNDASAHSENILQRNCMHVAAEAGSLNSLPILQNYITTEAMPGIVNSPDCNGTRPLHLASKEGHSDMLRSLMSIGADPHLQDANGRNALHVAKLFKQEKCVELLHEHSENRKIENG